MSLLNTKAPDFSLLDQDGKMHSLSQYKGKKILLYFYPKDDTPGCTTEACSFRDRLNELKKQGVQVLGVSADTEKSHKKFAEKFQLNFPLLADVDKKLIEDYGVWKQKSMFGKKYMGIDRSTFLIDKLGKIAHIWRGVKVNGHVDEILAVLAKISAKK